MQVGLVRSSALRQVVTDAVLWKTVQSASCAAGLFFARCCGDEGFGIDAGTCGAVAFLRYLFKGSLRLPMCSIAWPMSVTFSVGALILARYHTSHVRRRQAETTLHALLAHTNDLMRLVETRCSREASFQAASRR